MSAVALPPVAHASLSPRYLRAVDPCTLLRPTTLAVLGFGADAPRTLDDPRYLHIGLQSTDGEPWFEVWEAAEPVVLQRAGGASGVSGASCSGLAFGWMECEEDGIGLAAAAEYAYRQLLAHVQGSACPHLLRVWNYLDAITEGSGDAERYRQFCFGRAAGFQLAPELFPAATAIGRRDGRRVLTVYWLSAVAPGQPLENPRQIEAWRYPREYGPRAPTFARAMLAPPPLVLPLMLSGTAAVVGHASQHAGDLPAQLDETLRNFAALLEAARRQQPELPPQFDQDSLLKVYVSGDGIEALLASRLPADVPRLVLRADVCRTDLAIEIDGFHGC